ncbi:MAG: peptide chain release factor N(5)-glutamine methyltransferase [Bacillota bacterium]
MKSITIEEALKRASFCLQKAGVDQSRTEAEILLARIMQTNRLQLFLSQDNEVPPDIYSFYKEAVKRRCRGEPVAYILEEKYFYGFRFFVNSDVLIPRPETELIIESAVEWAQNRKDPRGFSINAIDLGTGSGILAITLALLFPEADVWAVEYSLPALEVARYNAALHNLTQRIHFYHGNYFSALDIFSCRPKFNLIVSNPPYVNEQEMIDLPKDVKNYEPGEALFGGKDGLVGFRTILEQLPEFTADNFLLLLEAGAEQKEKIEVLVTETGIIDQLTWRYDLNGWPRVLEAAPK